MFTFAFVTGFQNVVMFTMLFCILSILHDANDVQMYGTFTTWKSIVTTMLHVVYHPNNKSAPGRSNVPCGVAVSLKAIKVDIERDVLELN